MHIISVTRGSGGTVSGTQSTLVAQSRLYREHLLNSTRTVRGNTRIRTNT